MITETREPAQRLLDALDRWIEVDGDIFTPAEGHTDPICLAGQELLDAMAELRAALAA